MMNHTQDLKRMWSLIKIGVFVVSMIGMNTGCSEVDKGWSPGTAPDDGWTVPTLYHRAVEDGFTGTALVRYRGDMLLNSAAGFADKEAGSANMTDTVFNIGSITKQYTGALIMSLQEGGFLKVEDRLSDHFNNVPPDKADITIHQLLTHTAGFAVGLGRDYDPISREEYLALAWSIPLQGSPGAEFSYSNVGYSIAAAVAETVTGQSYESALVERLFAPAGINETGYVLPDWSGRLIAIGYNESGSLATHWTDQSISIEYNETGSLATQEASWTEEGPYWHLRGNGGLLTTTSDLLKWNDALSGTGLLSASGIEVLQGRHAEISGQGSRFYGYGIWATDSPIGSLHWHGGANGFNYAQMLRFIDDDLVVIILSNEDSDVARYLPMGLARAASSSLVNWHSPFDN